MDPGPEMGEADLLVALEGDVPADHVVEQDPQGPDRRLFPVVAGLLDPFRGRVHPGTCARYGTNTNRPR